MLGRRVAFCEHVVQLADQGVVVEPIDDEPDALDLPAGPHHAREHGVGGVNEPLPAVRAEFEEPPEIAAELVDDLPAQRLVERLRKARVFRPVTAVRDGAAPAEAIKAAVATLAWNRLKVWE